MKMQTIPRSASLLLLCSCLAACYQQAPPAAQGVAVAAPAPASASPAVVARVTCDACGVIRSVTALRQDGQASGAGAVIGGIVGGVAGNQVGGGSGRKIATVAGVIGGAVAGNEIEQNRNGTTSFEVVVDMEGGGQQVVTVADASRFSPGMEVRVQGGNISVR